VSGKSRGGLVASRGRGNSQRAGKKSKVFDEGNPEKQELSVNSRGSVGRRGDRHGHQSRVENLVGEEELEELVGESGNVFRKAEVGDGLESTAGSTSVIHAFNQRRGN